MEQAIGFIGLGIMGKPMSKNLLKAGCELIVYDIMEDRINDVVAAGAQAGGSPKAVAEKCEIIITMLPNSPHVKEVILEHNPEKLLLPLCLDLRTLLHRYPSSH